MSWNDEKITAMGPCKLKTTLLIEAQQLFSFMIAESQRLHRNRMHRLLNEPENQEPLGLDYILDFASGSEHRINVGSKALRQLDALCEKILIELKLDHKIHFRNLAKQIAVVCAPELKQIKSDQFASWFNQATELATQNILKMCKPRLHYFPLNLMLADVPPNFSFGPVVFHKSDTLFTPEFLDKISSKHDNQYVNPETLREYYNPFGTTIEISAPSADSETSIKLSENVANAATAFLSFLIEHPIAYRLKVGGPQPSSSRTFHFSIVENDIATIATNSSDHPFPVEGWWTHFSEDSREFIFQNLGKALSNGLLSARPIIAATQFTSSVKWYAEGQREIEPAARLLKFCTAIEIVVFSGEHSLPSRYSIKKSGITQNFVRRAKGLAAIAAPNKNANYQKIYSARSDVIHGRRNIRRSKLIEEANYAEELAKDAIQGALMLFGHFKLFENRTITPKNFVTELDRFVEDRGAVWAKTRSQPSPG